MDEETFTARLNLLTTRLDAFEKYMDQDRPRITRLETALSFKEQSKLQHLQHDVLMAALEAFRAEMRAEFAALKANPRT